ncbi:MAG: peptide-methionine (S)-S-oxide reductase MsrA [Paraglaciecola sp.]|uniref:peptide-methionine (S)-S-oxide reductase MsrA n=1 Tax=Paraglaciecola sp. TaxID=1920173 RepID=UPI003266AE22
MKYTVVVLFFIIGAFSLETSAEKAIFAGGCFWCMESDFEKLDGVNEVISGFTGGTLENPTYRGNHYGHYEAVEIDYDASKLSYRDLLDHYWINIDPFDDSGQFCDKGFSYKSAIFVANEDEKRLAEASKQLVISKFPEQTVVTPILNTTKFYPIKGNEIHHQDYYKKSPVRYKLYRWNCGRDQRLQEIWGVKK